MQDNKTISHKRVKSLCQKKLLSGYWSQELNRKNQINRTITKNSENIKVNVRSYGYEKEDT